MVMRLQSVFGMVVLFLLCAVADASAQSLSSMEYGLSALDNWSGCSQCTTKTSLNYTHSQINQLDTELNSDGMGKKFKFFNNYVWPNDMIEDELGGNDYAFADGVELYALSSHGDAVVENGQQVYYPSMCSYTENVACEPSSKKMVMGEQSSYTYGTVHPGRLLWLILATCFSVDTNPSQQWKLPFMYGLEMVMGYRGESADSTFTDEVLADFAGNAFGGESKFKQVWFSATEDWYIDDTSGIITCHGTNTGYTTDDLINRLNNYRRTWTKRYNNGTQRACAYAHHQG